MQANYDFNWADMSLEIALALPVFFLQLYLFYLLVLFVMLVKSAVKKSGWINLIVPFFIFDSNRLDKKGVALREGFLNKVKWFLMVCFVYVIIVLLAIYVKVKFFLPPTPPPI